MENPVLQSILLGLAGLVVPGCAALSYYMINVQNGNGAKSFIIKISEEDMPNQMNAAIMTYYAIVLLLGALALMSKFLSKHYPSFANYRIYFTKSFSVAFNAIVVWTIVLGFQIWLLVYWMQGLKSALHSPTYWRPLFRALGAMSAVQIGLTFLPLSRNGLLPRVLGLNFLEGPLSFHRLSGALAVFLGALHFVAFFASIYIGRSTVLAKKLALMVMFMIGEPAKYESAAGITGILALGLFLWGALFAIEWVRRRSYIWFYINHFVLIPATIAGAMHADPVFYCTLPGFILYMLDGIYRLATRDLYRIKEISIEPNDYVKIVISSYTHRYEPGQYVKVALPSMAEFESHPFTIASPANDRNLVLLLKPNIGANKFPNGRSEKNSWTSKLFEYSIRWQASAPGAVARVSLPLGNAEPSAVSTGSLAAADRVLVLVAGSGVSGGLSVAATALKLKYRVFAGVLPLSRAGTDLLLSYRDVYGSSREDGFEDTDNAWLLRGAAGQTALAGPSTPVKPARAARNGNQPQRSISIKRHLAPLAPPVKFVWINRNPASSLTSTYMDLLSSPGADLLLDARVMVSFGDSDNSSLPMMEVGTHSTRHSPYGDEKDLKVDNVFNAKPVELRKSPTPKTAHVGEVVTSAHKVNVADIINTECDGLRAAGEFPHTLSIYVCGPKSFVDDALRAIQKQKAAGRAISVFSEGYFM